MTEIDDLRARIDSVEETLGLKTRAAHALAAAHDREIADLQAQRQADAHHLDERFEWLQGQLHESGRLHGETRADMMEIKRDVAAITTDVAVLRADVAALATDMNQVKSALSEILGLVRNMT